MSRLFILTLGFATLLIHRASAQYTDSTSYYAGYISTGSINKTNDGDSYLLNNAVKFGVRKKSISLNANNSWVYGKQDKSLTNNDFSSSLDFNLYKTFPHFFYWGLANYNTSYSLKINNQLLAGAGVAYNLVDQPQALLNISDGILYDKSDLLLEDSIPDRYHTFRNSFRLLFKFTIRKVITLEGSNFVQSSLNDKHDYIFRSNTSLSVKLINWLSFTTAYNFNRINRTGRQNSLLNYGLTLEKYF